MLHNRHRVFNLIQENRSLKTELDRVNKNLFSKNFKLICIIQTANELKRANEQYKAEFRKNEEQQTKADHVLRRLKADYDEHIAVIFDYPFLFLI